MVESSPKLHTINTPCTHTPIWNNPDYLQDKKTLNFTTRKDKGITQLQHIVRDSTFIPFGDVVHKHRIDHKSYFQYLQLKSIINKTRQYSNIKVTAQNRILSKMYKLINTDQTISNILLLSHF